MPSRLHCSSTPSNLGFSSPRFSSGLIRPVNGEPAFLRHYIEVSAAAAQSPEHQDRVAHLFCANMASGLALFHFRISVGQPLDDKVHAFKCVCSLMLQANMALTFQRFERAAKSRPDSHSKPHHRSAPPATFRCRFARAIPRSPTMLSRACLPSLSSGTRVRLTLPFRFRACSFIARIA